MAATTSTSDDRVMATAQQILKRLNPSKEVREDMLMILSSYDNRLSNITDLINGEDAKTEGRFEVAEKVILRWDSSSEAASRHHSVLWEDSPDDAAEYLSAVDEVLSLVDGLSIRSGNEFVDRAESAIQLAMSRLEDEFRHILVRNTVPLDSELLHGSVRRLSTDVEFEADADAAYSDDDDPSTALHHRGASLADDLSLDLIVPEAVSELREIADRMLRAGYDKECFQVYTAVRRDAIEECLLILGLEKLSIEDVQKIEWKSLDEKMKKWIQAIKICVRVLLAGERRLCDAIFSDDLCFNDTAKACVMQLLNFGEAVAIGRRSPEKLFRILDMYDALADVLPDLETMVTDEVNLGEARGVLAALGDAARGTFIEFENAVQSEASRKPMVSGEIHPLARYVMNYLRLLVDYSKTLNSLLERDYDHDRSSLVEEDDSENMSPIGKRLLVLITVLESNLEEKSKLYEDGAMRCIFLMNNILYLVQKVKDSDLGKLLGDRWVRKRRGLVRQYATSYLRASWTKALMCLKDEGIGGSGSSNASKMALKERFKNFNACFEDIYRAQSAWKVPDPQLREELRISISEKVIPAYRSFMGRFGSQLETGRHAGRYIKYTPEDLENYLLDLFEGTPVVMHHLRRKNS